MEIGEQSFETNEEMATESSAPVNGPEVYPPAVIKVFSFLDVFCQY